MTLTLATVALSGIAGVRVFHSKIEFLLARPNSPVARAPATERVRLIYQVDLDLIECLMTTRLLRKHPKRSVMTITFLWSSRRRRHQRMVQSGMPIFLNGSLCRLGTGIQIGQFAQPIGLQKQAWCNDTMLTCIYGEVMFGRHVQSGASSRLPRDCLR